MKNVKKTVMLLLCLGIFFATAFVYSINLFTDSKNTQMSEEVVMRAKEHLSHIAAKNHALTYEGEINKVREYLTGQFHELGVDYSEYKDTYKEDEFIDIISRQYEDATEKGKKGLDKWASRAGFQSYSDYVEEQMDVFGVEKGTEYPITSYLIKLDAPDSDEGIMMVAHYDNAWSGTGAADDGMAVAGMLEAIHTAKNLKCSNDLYFLFTDAEEVGCRGAEHFVKNDADLKDKIALVVNYEARGSSGPELLFETSTYDYGIVREMSKAMDDSTGFSFGTAVYKYMPNGTDLTKFLEDDYAGVNFACIGTEETYHTVNDTMEHLSDSTFYEAVMGQQQIVTYFANANLKNLKSNANAVFFTAIKNSVIVVKENVARIFSVVIAMLSLLVVIWMSRKEKRSIRGLLLSVGILVALLGIVFVVSTGAGFATASKYQNIYWKVMVNKGTQADADQLLQMGEIFRNVFYLQIALSFLVTTVGIVVTAYRGKLYQEMICVSLIANSIFCLLLSIFFNGASYIASIPEAVFLVAILIKRRKKGTMVRLAYAFFYAIVAGVSIFPIILMVNQSLRSSIPLYLGGGLCVFAALYFCQGILLELQEDNF